MGFAEELQRAEQNVIAAKSNHANIVNFAAATVQRVEQNYWTCVRDLEAKVIEVRHAFVDGLSTCAGVTLYPGCVSDGETTAPLEPGVQASISTGGNKQYRGPDKRTLAITIDFPNGMRIVAMGNPDREGEARAFAALVMNTSAKIDGSTPSLDAELARLQNELAIAQADTGAIQAAQYHYQMVCNDTAAVWAAEQALAALRASAPQADFAAYENSKRRMRTRDRVLAIVAGVVVVAVVVAAMVFAFGKVGETVSRISDSPGGRSYSSLAANSYPLSLSSLSEIQLSANAAKRLIMY